MLLFAFTCSPEALNMPKPKSITPVHALHLRRFTPELRRIEKLPKQNSPAVNELKNNFYANSTRSLMCAFGWPDTLGNLVAGEGTDWDYKHIPQLPPLDAEQTALRAGDLAALTVVSICFDVSLLSLSLTNYK